MSKQTTDISILDCTLRDGSYAIDYKFTALDTFLVSFGLEKAGFQWIEIGHGLGLGASEAGKGKAACTDREYLEVIKSSLSPSKFGMFFIPGIGKIEDIELAAEYGLGFIRIGTNVTEIDSAKPYIEKAKSLGLTTFSNLMKSYAVPIDEFVKLAKRADIMGVDFICVVDSAGGMLPGDVREYISRLKDVTDKKIGFHGHNNLQLAMANTIEAIKAGASMVDSSLQGMGRSAGNTQTEVLLMLMEKFGYDTGIDVYKAMDLGERIVKPMMIREQGVDDIGVVSGLACFHSSFLKTIYEIADKHKVDPRRLIIEVSKVDCVNVTYEMAEERALELSKDGKYKNLKEDAFYIPSQLFKQKTTLLSHQKALQFAQEMVNQAKKNGKKTVFTITLNSRALTVFPFIRQNSFLVIGNVEAGNMDEVLKVIKILDGIVDWILLDHSHQQIANACLENEITKSEFAWYSEKRVIFLSVIGVLCQIKPKKPILILADKTNLQELTIALVKQNFPVYIPPEQSDFYKNENNSLIKIMDNWESSLQDVSIIISFEKANTWQLEKVQIENISHETIILEARPGVYSDVFLNKLLVRNQSVLRVDMSPGLSAELTLAIETKRAYESRGAKDINGYRIISGGFIGNKGDIVVDSVNIPSRVIGIANGKGGLLSEKEDIDFSESRRFVEDKIISDLLEQ